MRSSVLVNLSLTTVSENLPLRLKSNGNYNISKNILGLDQPKSVAIYAEANKLIETLGEMVYVLMAKVAPIFSMFPKTFVCLFVYFTTDSSSDVLVLPIPMWYVCYFMIPSNFFSFDHTRPISVPHSIQRFPFDAKNLRGYLSAVALEYIGNTLIYCFVADLVALGVAGLLFTLSMTKVMRSNFNLINKTAKLNGTPMDYHNQISYTIRLHSNGKQFSAIAL